MSSCWSMEPELNYQAGRANLLAITLFATQHFYRQSEAAFSPFQLLTLKIYNLQLNCKPLEGTCNPFFHRRRRILKWFNFNSRRGSPEKTFKNTLRLVTCQTRLRLGEYYLWIINQIFGPLGPVAPKLSGKLLCDECVQIESIMGSFEGWLPSTGCTFLHLDYWRFQLALEPLHENLINSPGKKGPAALQTLADKSFITEKFIQIFDDFFHVLGKIKNAPFEAWYQSKLNLPQTHETGFSTLQIDLLCK